MAVDSNSHDSSKKISVCVKAIVGQLSANDVMRLEEDRGCLGTQGILFVLLSLQSHENKNRFWEENFLRLEQILKFNDFVPSIPLVILLSGWSIEEFNAECGEEKLRLKDFQNNGWMSNYFLKYLPETVATPSSNQQLLESLRVLAESKPPLPSLSSQPMSDFIEDAVMQWFSIPAFQNLAERRRQNVTHQEPHVLIALYNAAISNAIYIVTSPSLERISWPIAEFANADRHPALPSLEWNSETQFSYLRKTLSQLRLPSFDEITSDSWESGSNQLRNYVSHLPIHEGNKPYLCTKIHKLLKNSYKNLLRRCHVRTSYSPKAYNIPWTDIIQTVVECMISNWNSDLLNTTFDEMQLVYYLNEEFNEYEFPEEWKEATRMYNNSVTYNRNELQDHTAVKRKQPDLGEGEIKRQALVPEKSTLDEDYGLEGLLQKIRAEKGKSLEFEEKLLKCLDTDDSLSKGKEAENNDYSFSFNDTYSEEPIDSTDDHSSLSEAEAAETPSSMHPNMTLREQLIQLQTSIHSQKLQDELFERKLRLLCNLQL